jgi:hypothetical protein
MDEFSEQHTVVFGWIVTEQASGRGGGSKPPPPPPYTHTYTHIPLRNNKCKDDSAFVLQVPTS